MGFCKSFSGEISNRIKSQHRHQDGSFFRTESTISISHTVNKTHIKYISNFHQCETPCKIPLIQFLEFFFSLAAEVFLINSLKKSFLWHISVTLCLFINMRWYFCYLKKIKLLHNMDLICMNELSTRVFNCLWGEVHL